MPSYASIQCDPISEFIRTSASIIGDAEWWAAIGPETAHRACPYRGNVWTVSFDRSKVRVHDADVQHEQTNVTSKTVTKPEISYAGTVQTTDVEYRAVSRDELLTPNIALITFRRYVES
ncbi:uncharacterized protein ColSpa_07752 [Colletotrichum spaethianum]|uniref:Uncharacterized protein n=1 Tax=Colletotrichum spaethianum TaxID=700344 RepID=A0AA37P8F9_9PEZI|nr:uncharacterized protein ColSpa_07752 [Colletotrichum spaethianum]GKT47571.1 hypothetical protein ColSpa_07752 [Colletotrichum spaethianum]